MTRSEHGPVRTCVGCRTVRVAADMRRVTRDPDTGALTVGGPSRGRGAWICSDACWDSAHRRRILDRVGRSQPPTG